MAIQIDAQGFIIGEKRLKEMSDGIIHTKENTKEILSVLVKKMDELRRDSLQNIEIQQQSLNRQNRSGQSLSASSSDVPNQVIRRSIEASTELASSATRILRQTQSTTSGNSMSSGGLSSVRDRVERQRDGNGRFVGSADKGESREVKSFLGRVKGLLPDNNGVDIGGVDPTVDAVKELSSVVNPVGRIFGGMSARAIGVFRGRSKKRRNEEVLPDEQIRANDIQERQDRQRNKLLQRLINVVAVSGSGRGGGLLGGLLGGGRGRGGMLKGLLRKVPLLGALIGGASLVGNWDSSNSGQKGKDIGAMIGTGIGGALGSFLGLGGTVAGSALGSYLGGIFGEKIGKWTDSLENQKLGDVFKDVLKGTVAGILAPVKLPFDALRSAGSVYGRDKGQSSFGGFFDGGGLPAPTKVGKLSDEKAKTISRVANNIGVDPNDLASIISFETVGTFSPSIKNPKSSATGLLQFMEGSGGTKGQYYGMSREQFSGLSFDEQMQYVERYYKERGFDGKTKRSLADAYTAVTGYGYKKGSKAYELNKVWDANGDGYISKGEAVSSKNFQAHRKQWIKEEGPLNVGQAKGVPYSREVINSSKSSTIPLKVQPVKPEVARMKPELTANTSKAPSDAGISQIVSDRSLAHIFSGSIGFDNHVA